MKSPRKIAPFSAGTSFSVVLLFSAFSLFGLFFLPLLSLRMQPAAGTNTFTIVTHWGNSSPTNVEWRITSKIEGAVNRLEGIKKISSVSSKGKSVITVEVDKYSKSDKLRLNISSVIRRLYAQLPEDAGYPLISSNTPDNNRLKPLMIYTLHGIDDGFTLKKYAENNIKTSLALLPGIKKTIVYGGTGYCWQIAYKRDIIQRYNIVPDIIRDAIRNYFDKQSVGVVYDSAVAGNSNSRVSVIIENSIADTVEWQSIPVKKVENHIVYLGEIAEVERVEKEAYSYFRVNGQDAVDLVIYPSKGSNSIELSKSIKNSVSNIKKQLPAGYVLSLTYDSSGFIKAELAKIIKRTLLTLLILLVFVFLVSFNIRYVLAIVLSLFTNLALSFFLYYIIGIEIHLYSMAGITVSLGLIIDNSIVMTDHLLYRKNMKIYMALLASTLTTMGSLIVVWFLPAELRLKLWDFAIIIVVNLFVSLVVSLFYIPALLSLLKIGNKQSSGISTKKRLIVLFNKGYFYILRFLLKYRAVSVLALVILFGIPVYMLPNSIEGEGVAAKLYNNTIGGEWYIDNLKPYVNKYLGGTLRLFSYYVFENSYFTEPKETKLYVQASMPKGGTLKQMNDVFINIEHFLLQYKNKINFYSKIQSPQYAEIEITFKDGAKADVFPYLLKSKLIGKSLNMGGISWNIYGVGKGFSLSAEVNEMVDYKVALYGYNFDKLEQLAAVFKEKLITNPRVKNVNLAGNLYWWERKKSYEYYTTFDKETAAFYHADLLDIYHQLKNKTLQAGGYLRLFINNHYESVNLVPDDIKLMDKWLIFNEPSVLINHKLDEFTTITKEPELQSVFKENQNYIRIVNYQYLGTSKFGNQHLKKVIDKMKDVLPPGYRIKSLQGYWNNTKQAVSYILLITLIIIIIFVLCAVLFESLLKPIAIILTIPFSFIGIFIIFYLFDFNFDQGGYASFILVSGLVVNSAIYLLNEFDRINHIYKTRNVLSIYIKAFNRKIIPILLTIGSTVLGLIPFIVFGKNDPFWFALAVGTIGGLSFSIFVMVIYFPLFVLKRSRK